ncbi:galactosylceramidase [Streptomyces spiralis]|uniref:galactosylceramidase n=1 Tax=Streptomyces spiralis TaxID=66376 RepID=A0A918ZSQ1_9ACTN|nr:galactosylceramidase [Streptomyces spiralis]GHE68462.1 galactosylceramidase [Streptomyces spiralis]
MPSTRRRAGGLRRLPERTARAVCALLVSCLALVAPATAHAETDALPVQQITVDGDGTGRVFDGVGAISGGGGTSRLLVDYPEPERSRILDYLFKPGYGASLQILKVEIGADTNSSNGAEPSHMRTRTQVDCDRGYEWWLMEQARKRNPDIRFYGLEWGAPGWFDGGFWSQDNIDYLMQWLGCAERHDLHVDYLGGWNEKGWDAAWYGKLKAALVRHGHGDVKVVAADNAGWQVATDMKNDPAFDAATDVVGIHYPCSAVHCSSSADALGLDKPLFASESGWNNYLTGATRLAAEMNHEYVDSRITAFINWPAAYAWYPTVQMQGSGLLRANEPWSGHYELGPTLWTIAQTAQFTRPGWSYVDSASGYLDGGGTYVTLRSPGPRPAYTTVFETTAATAPQNVSVTPTGKLPRGALHRWTTTLESTDPSDWFVRGADVSPDATGGHGITLQPGTVTTLTTMPGGKGSAAARAPRAEVMALPYRDGFDSYPTAATPRYVSDMEGAFQVAPCSTAPQAASGSGGTGGCLRQAITTQPTKWSRVASPLTLSGDSQWTDYTVSAKVMIDHSGTGSLLGRVVNQLNNAGPARVNVWEGYYLKLSDSGTWALEVIAPDKTTRVLANGTLPSAAADTWHRLTLGFSGDTITARVDGTEVAHVTDSTYGHGQVGLGLDSYTTSRFDDLEVLPARNASTVTP